MDFDLRQLEIFCSVVEHGSFSRAARAVHLAQASVSERIATLERSVGAKLLDRLGRRVAPTAIGRRLYEGALGLLEAKRAVRAELQGLLGMRHGTLEIGASTIPAEFVLPGVIARFRERHPDVVVRVIVGDTEETASRVVAGTVEAGVVGFRAGQEHVRVRPLWRDELVLVTPHLHAWTRRGHVCFEDLRAEPFIAREPGSGTRRSVERHVKKHLRPGFAALNVVAEFGSTSAIKAGIKEGLGVSILSLRAVTDEVRTGALSVIPLEGGPFERRFYLVEDGRRTPSPLRGAFTRFLIDDASAG